MKTDYICTWIYLDSPDERSEYPQVGAQSHLFSFQKIYWKCVAVFFACSKKFNPDRQHILFTNKPENDLPEIDGLALIDFFKKLEVKIVSMPMTWQTPPGFYHKWRNQFFVFDIFNWLEKNCSDEKSAFLLLDSDCIIRENLDELFSEIRNNGLLTLPMPFDLEYDINGITRRDMRQIYAELDGRDPGFDPIYYGGEFFASNLDNVKNINRMMPTVWEALMQRFREGKKKFHYEGPTLSYMYFKIRKFATAERFIKRIWTSHKFSNVQSEDARLSILHLPAEKTGGIALLFNLLKKGELPGSEELGGYLGVPKRKRFLDFKHFLKYSWVYRWWLGLNKKT